MSIIIFGPIASGKSSHIAKLKAERGVVATKDLDKAIWRYIPSEYHELCRRSVWDTIQRGDSDSLDTIIKVVANMIDWDRVFAGAYIYEASVLGRWWNAIPDVEQLVAGHTLVKVMAEDEETRNKFLAKRGISKETAALFDAMYIDPPFFHETVYIKYKE